MNVFCIKEKCFKKEVLENNLVLKKLSCLSEKNGKESSFFIIPGVVDSHVHIESSMLLPNVFYKELLKNGILGAVVDVHEMANVGGREYVEYMQKISNKDNGLFFMIPSCVPATPFDNTGGTISLEEVKEMFLDGKCKYYGLAEMMDVESCVSGDKSALGKIEAVVKNGGVVDGHAPLLRGEKLKKYLSLGITTDHECTSIEEALEKIELGVSILVREGSVAKDLDNLLELFKTNEKDVMYCTDDSFFTHIKNLKHIEAYNRVLNSGVSLSSFVQMFCLNPVEKYKLPLVYKNEKEELNDFIVLEVKNNKIERVVASFLKGKPVYNYYEDCSLNEKIENKSEINTIKFEKNIVNNFFVNNISKTMLSVDNQSVGLNNIRVITCEAGSLLTGIEEISLKLKPKGETIEEFLLKQKIYKIVVLNRYKKSLPSVGFIKGIDVNCGAIASTVSHDSHNIVCIGANDELIVKAIEEINRLKGGKIFVSDKGEVSSFALPVGGLMSAKLDINDISKEYAQLMDALKKNGIENEAVYMIMAFMSLVVIPFYKINDQGLFDTQQQKYIDVFF